MKTFSNKMTVIYVKINCNLPNNKMIKKLTSYKCRMNNYNSNMIIKQITPFLLTIDITAKNPNKI